MSRTKPRINIYAILLPLGTLFGVMGWAAWWFTLATGIRGAVDDWAAARRAEGWTVTYGKPDLGGFPQRAEVRISAPAFQTPDGIAWKGPDLVVFILPTEPGRAVIEARGEHRLTLPGAQGPVQAVVKAAQATLALLLDGGRLAGSEARFENAEIGLPDGVLRFARLGLGHQSPLPPPPVTPPANPPDDGHTVTSLVVRADATGIDLPQGHGPVLGPRIAAASFDGRVLGRLAPAPPLAALRAWRDAGGTVEIDRAALRWEPLDLAAHGTLALDSKLQPTAALTATLRGFFQTVDALNRAQMIRTRDASMAKLILGALAKVPPEGGPPVLTVPLTVQGGMLSAGPSQLMPVPPIVWEDFVLLRPAGRK